MKYLLLFILFLASCTPVDSYLIQKAKFNRAFRVYPQHDTTTTTIKTGKYSYITIVHHYYYFNMDEYPERYAYVFRDRKNSNTYIHYNYDYKMYNELKMETAFSNVQNKFDLFERIDRIFTWDNDSSTYNRISSYYPDGKRFTNYYQAKEFYYDTISNL